MDFPTLVFKCPGTNQRPGGTFNWIGANDQVEFDRLVGEGWFATLPEAIDAHDKPVGGQVKTVAVPNDDAKPTREELEQKATELGIGFGPKVSDKKLGELISKKLAETPQA